MSLSYVLITPARNEESFIEKTIQSVINQTVLPQKWIIVSDGSTDRTDEIVTQYATSFDFIQLVRVNTDTNHNFGSKVNAFNNGYKNLKNINYYFIGNLDADVSFESHYFQTLIDKFRQNTKLGITGGIILEKFKDGFQERIQRLDHVAGAVQLFRRECYEEIGGYFPLKRGGIDDVAEFTARMYGWECKTFPDLKVFHYRYTGFAKGNIILASFNQGIIDYSLRYHPVFEFLKFFYRITEKPFIINSFSRLFGYCWAFFRREEQCLQDDVVKYLRKEQFRRVLSTFSRNKKK